MKTPPTRTKWILVLSSILAAVLLICCYSAVANARRAGTKDAKDARTAADVSSTAQILEGASRPDDENDPEYAQGHREFLNGFEGPAAEDVSPAAFATALAAARAVPPSPLSRKRAWLDTPTPWTFPVPPPLFNDHANLGGGCRTPFFPDSPCGAGARIDAIAVQSTNADIVYMGSEGGLAKSSNGGVDWSYLSDGLDSQSIRSIAIDPIAPNIVYAGTGTNTYFGNGIYRSTDGGATWLLFTGPSDQLTASTVAKIVIDPATAGSTTGTTLYASVITVSGGVNTTGTHSIWKSTNSGSTWSLKRGPTSGAPYGPHLGSFYDIVINPGPPSILYITEPDGVFKSTDGGISWSSNLYPITGTSSPSCLAFAQSVLYLAYKDVSTSLITVLKSSNQGSTWTPLPSSGTTSLYCFGVDPIHPNRIFVGGGGDLLYSMDSGNSWLSSHYVHVDIHSIAFCPTNSQRNYLGTDGGIYRADYVGPDPAPISWYSKNEHLAGALIQGVSLSSDGHIVIGTQDNGTQLYAGSNPPWTQPHGGDGFKPQIDQTNSNKFYYVGLSYGHPVDGSWVPLTRVVDGVSTNVTPPGACGEDSSTYPALFMAPSDSARVIMGFVNVWRSVNSGDSWTRIGGSACVCPTPTPGVGPGAADVEAPARDPRLKAAVTTPFCGISGGLTIKALYEAPSDPQVIYVAMNGFPGKVFVTTNANAGTGATWVDRTPSGLMSAINAIVVDPTTPLRAYLMCNSGVYKTTTTGTTWNTITGMPGGPPANAMYADLAIDPSYPTNIYLASWAGVYASPDRGATWGTLSYGYGMPKGMAISSLCFNAVSRQLAAATYGRGVYLFDLSLP